MKHLIKSAEFDEVSAVCLIEEDETLSKDASG